MAEAIDRNTSAERFRSLVSRADLAALLGVSEESLAILLYRDRPDRYYTTWSIRKRSGGTRRISAPNAFLLVLQQRLNDVLQDVYTPRASTNGFVRGRSVVTNARPHVGKRILLNVDLENFFPSINFGRVRGLFMAEPFNLPHEVSSAIAALVCTENALPIGGATSPVIANMICVGMDVRLQRLARRSGCWYTRYADDLTFSTNRDPLPTELARRNELGLFVPGAALEQTIARSGFRINQRKFHIQRSDQRQRVTGIVVNERVNVDHRFVISIRAMLHNWERDGLDAVQTRFQARYMHDHRPDHFPSFVNVLRGKIQYLRMVRGDDDPVYLKYAAEFANLKDGRPRKSGRAATVAGRQVELAPDFRLLHLSDFHFRDATNWDSEPILRELVTLLADARDSYDAIVITGDVANSGASAEYDAAASWILSDLLNRLGVEPSRLFVVPGNHDVDRTQVGVVMRAIAKDVLSADWNAKLATMARRPAELAVLGERFQNFNAFVRSIGAEPSDGALWWNRSLEHHGRSIVLAGLCSPLLSMNDNEQGQLILGLGQVGAVTAATGDLHIALMHHPAAYFYDDDRSSRQRLQQWAHVILHGHTHHLDASSVRSSDSSVIFGGAGAAYQGSSYDGGCYIHEFDLAAMTMRTTAPRWSAERQKWIIGRDTFLTEDGIGLFDLKA